MMISLKGVPCKVYPGRMGLDFKYKKLPVLILEPDTDDDGIDDVKEIEEKLFQMKPSLKWNAENPEEDLNEGSESDPSVASREAKKKYVIVEMMVNLGEGSRIYKSFYAYMKNHDASSDETLKSHLLNDLSKLNDFIKSDRSPGKFLFGNKLRYPDCVLLPKLLHIKTVLKHLKGLEIPEDLTAIHDYLAAAAEEEAFVATSPTEKAIVEDYERQLKYR